MALRNISVWMQAPRIIGATAVLRDIPLIRLAFRTLCNERNAQPGLLHGAPRAIAVHSPRNHDVARYPVDPIAIFRLVQQLHREPGPVARCVWSPDTQWARGVPKGRRDVVVRMAARLSASPIAATIQEFAPRIQVLDRVNRDPGA
jgi:hypothetical protein